MTPKQLSKELLRIATSIERSKLPDRRRVFHDIHNLTRLASQPMVCITPGVLVTEDGETVRADHEDLDMACAFLKTYMNIPCKVMGNQVCILCDDADECEGMKDLILSMKYLDNAAKYPECAEKDAVRILLGKGFKLD